MGKKIVIGGIVGVIAIVAIVFVYVFSNIEDLIEQAVEGVGTAALKADVSLDKVELSLTSGKGGLKGLTIDNPKGFETPTAMKLGQVSVQVDMKQTTPDKIVVNEVLILAPDVTYEMGTPLSNMDILQKNVNDFVKENVGESSGGSSSSSGDGPKVIIENLIVRDGKVNVATNFPGLEGKSLSGTLPDIHLKDIGKEEGGTDPAKVVDELISAIVAGSTNVIGDLGVDEMVKGAAEAAGAAAEEATKNIGAAAEGAAGKAAGDAAEGAADAISGGVKSLFGK